jgi:hypothetical protein
LEKIHSLARKRGVEVLEVNPQDTSTIGMLKYAPLLHLSKDVAAAYVIGRRALGFEEKLPKGYEALLSDRSFLAHAEGFYRSRLQELTSLREAKKNPYLKRRLSREMGKARRALSLLLSFPGPQRGRKASPQGSSGSQRKSTDGRNLPGINPWRVLRVGLFLPLLGLEAPRDLSLLRPILHFTSLTQGSWKGRKVGSGPHPGGGPGCTNVHFCEPGDHGHDRVARGDVEGLEVREDQGWAVLAGGAVGEGEGDPHHGEALKGHGRPPRPRGLPTR